jgi:predicted nucleotidyltransferase
MPNEQYRKKTGYTGKNERLTVNKEYLDESIVMFENMANNIAKNLGKKFRIQS